MQYLSFILAILIFAIAVMPCSDGHTCDEEGQEIPIEHYHSEDEKDHCSPFCVCTCCGMKINFELKSNIAKPSSFSNLSFQFSYSFLYSFSYNPSIWHPPTFS